MTPDTEGIAERIVQDPKILVGKPTIKGTRISVELVLEHLAVNPDLDDLFAAYPELTIDDVRAVLAYARASVEQGQQAPRNIPTARGRGSCSTRNVESERAGVAGPASAQARR